MAKTRKIKPHLQGRSILKKDAGKRRKQKQPTQRTELQPVMIMGPTGKTHMGWQPWPDGKKK